MEEKSDMGKATKPRRSAHLSGDVHGLVRQYNQSKCGHVGHLWVTCAWQRSFENKVKPSVSEPHPSESDSIPSHFVTVTWKALKCPICI